MGSGCVRARKEIVEPRPQPRPSLHTPEAEEAFCSVHSSSEGKGVSWPRWRAASWSAETPKSGLPGSLVKGEAQLSQVPGEVACTPAPSAARLRRLLTMVMRSDRQSTRL